MDFGGTQLMRHNSCSCSFSDVFNFNHLSQVIGYEDESVEIYFKDGSNLQLSPCGANFRYTRAHNTIVPSLGRKQFEVTQRCIFTTSETRQKVITGLLIRNQMCSRPYLVAEFLSEMQVKPVRGYQKLVEIKWPQNTDAVCRNEDGSFTLLSLKGDAMLKVCSCKHAVVACYNVPLQDYNHVDAPNSAGKDNASNRSWSAIQNRIFPISSCPPEWAYPVSLIESVASGNASLNIPLNYKHTSPQCAPRKCPNQFRHFWRDVETRADDPDVAQLQEIPEFADTRIRFLWCEDNLYWISNDGDFPKIETWLKNGDVFKSHPKNERYFIHLELMRYPATQKVNYTERIISSAFIPNEAILKSVMLRCIRMISYKSRTSLSSVKGRNSCWDSKSDVPTESCATQSSLPNLKESVIIPTLGVFSAIADSIEISFNDGTMVHMNVISHQKHCSKLTGKKCRIVLKDGRYFLIDDLENPPACVENYVMHILAWLHWLTLPNLERIEHPFYSGTMYDQTQLKRVQKELDRLSKATSQCDKENFQYLELTGMPQVPISINDVTNALSHTSKAITDIDDIINQFKMLSKK